MMSGLCCQISNATRTYRGEGIFRRGVRRQWHGRGVPLCDVSTLAESTFDLRGEKKRAWIFIECF